MFARVAVYAVLLAACAAIARTQDTQIYVDVVPNSNQQDLTEDIEKRRLSDLERELNAARGDVMLLYTEYTAKAGADLKSFLKNISSFADEAVSAVDDRPEVRDFQHGDCQDLYEIQMRRVKLNAYRAATFSGENHHKFILGHMVVFRMHINKSDEYIKKCNRAIHNCGVTCEAKPRVKRWKRLAAAEIHRIQDDIQHTRKAYKDLVSHARKRLLHLKKQLTSDTTDAVNQYHTCLRQDDERNG